MNQKHILMSIAVMLCLIGTASATNITSWGNNVTNNDTLSITVDANQQVNFNATANQTITTWNWYIDDVDQSNNYDNLSAYWITIGNKTVSVNATNANGTSSTITWNVTVDPNTNYMSPLHVSPNGRYLMYENDTPFMYIAEVIWNIPRNASRENITWIYEQLNNDTIGGGVTVVQISILFPISSALQNVVNYYGYQAFNNGSIPDFTSPKEVAGDNNDFWDNIDYAIEEAKNHSLYVMICPIWANSYVNGYSGTTIISEADMRTHSEWLLDRYKNENHLLWMIGGDGYNPPAYGADHMYYAQAEGILKGKTGCMDCPKHNETSPLWSQTLMTHHSHPDNVSSDWYDINESWVQINGAYAGRNYEIWEAYNLENPIPIVEVEGYGFWSMSNIQIQRSRAHQYHHYLAGGRGFGHLGEYIWDLSGDWEARLIVSEREQFTIMASIFKSIAWYNLIPDQSIILSSNSYPEDEFLNVIMASTSSDENMIMVYFSPSSTKEAQIDLSNITTHTHANATWINTVNNTNLAGSTYLVSVDPTYTVPSGWEDAILLLEGYDAPAGTWNYYKEILINHSMVYEDLTNFSILINLTDSDLSDHAQVDGDDIIFRASDKTTQLDHEQEAWNKTTGDYVGWVRVPAVNSTINTTIYMYYNNSYATNSENAAGVWDSNYLIVQHLKESPDNSAGQIIDSTGNNNDGTTTDMGSSNQVSGHIDGSLDFDGSTEKVEFTDIDGSSAMAAITVSAWVNSDVKTDFDTIAEKNTLPNTNPVFRMFLDSSVDQKWRFKVWGDDGVTAGNIDSNAAAATGSWKYIVGRYNGSEVCMFVDGVKQSTTLAETGNLEDATNNARIGAGGQALDGKMDEFRVSKSARSDGWISTDYNSTKYPHLFISVGAEQYDAADSTVPTYASAAHNNTEAGASCTFSIQYDDNTALHTMGQYIFSTNTTGSWTNESAANWTATPEWANVTKTLNSTSGIVIGYRWYVDDNAGNINDSPIYALTTQNIPPASITGLTNTTNNFWHNWTWLNPADGDFNYTYVLINDSWKQNTSNEYYNLSADAHNQSTISTKTVDTLGNMNSTWVNHTSWIPNNAITITNTSDWSGTTGDNVYVDYDATDADSDSPTFSCNRTDLFTDFDTATGKGNWTYTTGTLYVDFGVSDGYGSTSNYTMTINVSAPSTIPVISNLHTTTLVHDRIVWGWTNPDHYDTIMVYIDNIWKKNTTTPSYSASGLNQATAYTIKLITVYAGEESDPVIDTQVTTTEQGGSGGDGGTPVPTPTPTATPTITPLPDENVTENVSIAIEPIPDITEEIVSNYIVNGSIWHLALDKHAVFIPEHRNIIACDAMPPYACRYYENQKKFEIVIDGESPEPVFKADRWITFITIDGKRISQRIDKKVYNPLFYFTMPAISGSVGDFSRYFVHGDEYMVDGVRFWWIGMIGAGFVVCSWRKKK